MSWQRRSYRAATSSNLIHLYRLAGRKTPMLDVTIQFSLADHNDDHGLREVDHRMDEHHRGLFLSAAGIDLAPSARERWAADKLT